jgi:hypothetical protein
VLIRGAEVEGRAPIDVRIAGDRIAEIGAALARGRGEPELDARGGALLPGTARPPHPPVRARGRAGLDCVRTAAVASEPQLAAALRAAAAHGSSWLRGIALSRVGGGPARSRPTRPDGP